MADARPGTKSGHFARTNTSTGSSGFVESRTVVPRRCRKVQGSGQPRTDSRLVVKISFFGGEAR